MLSQLKQKLTKKDILYANFGIERESLRVTRDGELAKTQHPHVFGAKMKHPYITTDFSESQIEMITPIFNTTHDVYTFLNALYDIVAFEIDDEILWPQSMPSIIPPEDEIPIAKFDDEEEGGREAFEYRKMLLQKYGGSRQLISGIHFNFSFSEEMLKKLYVGLENSLSYQEFKNQIYLKITRNYLRYRFFLIYFLGATPALPSTYDTKCTKQLKLVSDHAISNNFAISYRNSRCGYQNKLTLLPRYETIETYVQSIEDYIAEGMISSHKEVYNSIRLKAKNNHELLSSLKEDGISYLEIRSLDLNPFEKNGVALDDMNFIHLFLLFLLCEDEIKDDHWQEEGNENERMVSLHGQNRKIKLKRFGQEISLDCYIKDLLNKIKTINDELNLNFDELIEDKYKILNQKKPLRAEKVLSLIKESGYIHAQSKLGESYKIESVRNGYLLQGFEMLELSTQILIRDCLKYGLKVKVLDHIENFIEISNNEKVEYVKQATKTSLDSYSTVLIMENKVITKEILSKHNVNVPQSDVYENREIAYHHSKTHIGKPIVVKPKSTNFGLGISIFPNKANKEEYEKAIDIAFSHDASVMVEQFISGKEYRFLVINEKVIGVLHRVPANVEGDGIHSIEQLVELKNRHPLRGKGYKKPLEKIVIDESAVLFLESQGYHKKSIIPLGKTVYLRENSNVSTGGDSLDFTDEIPKRFKELAIKAAKAVNATICGVDMMIENINDENSHYAIIELNFNPAIHIHCYPYKGKNRNVGYYILNALGFIQ